MHKILKDTHPAGTTGPTGTVDYLWEVGWEELVNQGRVVFFNFVCFLTLCTFLYVTFVIFFKEKYKPCGT